MDEEIEEIVNKLPVQNREYAFKILTQKKKEKELREKVHKHVCTLIEVVDIDELSPIMNDLDKTTWINIIEERYISLMCGLPICPNPVEKPKNQKYIIDFEDVAIYENNSEELKFCSKECRRYSNFLKAQLFDEPLWLRDTKIVKTFDMDINNQK
uniref:RNA polymerase II subunit B1 CTD phosphatase RPAP2 homolog n=1 Tax=Parastrongyloides trichosuri TaxID=131310 RepID=A0A0N4Z6N4_PARTI